MTSYTGFFLLLFFFLNPKKEISSSGFFTGISSRDFPATTGSFTFLCVSVNTMDEKHPNFLVLCLPTECFATQQAGTRPNTAPFPSGALHNGWKKGGCLGQLCVSFFRAPKQGRQGLLLFSLHPREETPPLVKLHCISTQNKSVNIAMT